MNFHPIYPDKIIARTDGKLTDDCCCPCAINVCTGLGMNIALNGFRDYLHDEFFPGVGGSRITGLWSVLGNFSTSDLSISLDGTGVTGTFHLGTHLSPTDRGLLVRKLGQYNSAGVFSESTRMYVYQIQAALLCYAFDPLRCTPIPAVNCLEPQFGLDRTTNFQGTYLKLFFQIWDMVANDWAASQLFINFTSTMGAGSNAGATRIYGKWKGPPLCQIQDPNPKATTIDTLQETALYTSIVYQNLAIVYNLHL